MGHHLGEGAETKQSLMNDYEFWSSRYNDQASWTRETRNFILQQISLPHHSNILEVGCGSLAVLRDFNELHQVTFGVDIDLEILKFSKKTNMNSNLINADGLQIPFAKESFDLCFCHYLLLWITNPISILREMTRVTKINGWICCFAEPDYLARIDYPSPLDQLGWMQNSSLSNQGVNLSSGRNITNWLKEASLNNIHWGIFGSHQKVERNIENADTEWKTINLDLENLYSAKEIHQYKEIELKAQSQGIRILFIPTFYAYAKK